MFHGHNWQPITWTEYIFSHFHVPFHVGLIISLFPPTGQDQEFKVKLNCINNPAALGSGWHFLLNMSSLCCSDFKLGMKIHFKNFKNPFFIDLLLLNYPSACMSFFIVMCYQNGITHYSSEMIDFSRHIPDFSNHLVHIHPFLSYNGPQAHIQNQFLFSSVLLRWNESVSASISLNLGFLELLIEIQSI